MKIGIFADIHGNIYAFERVLEALRKESCDLYCFAGDICGYYYHQNEVIDLLRQMKNLVCVAGNHDDIFLRMLDDAGLEDNYSKKYGKSLSLLKGKIRSDNLEYLKKLPRRHEIKELGLGIFHGSPWDELDGYIYPDAVLDRFDELPCRVVVLGHTHYPMDRMGQGVRVINPGSCGQPRDDNEPSYATLDLGSGEARFHRVRYDENLMIRDVIGHNEENPYLISVLKRKREEPCGKRQRS